MNNEYVFQLDRRDLYMKLAKEELAKDDAEVRNSSVFEGRRADYSDCQNVFNTYRVPSTNKYLDQIRAADK